MEIKEKFNSNFKETEVKCREIAKNWFDDRNIKYTENELKILTSAYVFETFAPVMYLVMGASAIMEILEKDNKVKKWTKQKN